MKQIATRSNPLVKRIAALARSARERKKLGQTVLDGAHLIGAALDASVPLVLVLVSERGVQRDEHRALLTRIGNTATRHLVADAVFDQISPVDTPTGILALINTPSSDASSRATSSVMVLDAVQDAGNVGALLRTAAAAGLKHVLLTAGCAQAWSPRVLRAAMGAHFVLDVSENADAAVFLRGYSGQCCITALSENAERLFDVDLRGDVAWVFGAEGAGVSPDLARLATRQVMIPMPGQIESLNVAAAAAVCLFEQVRQKRSLDARRAVRASDR